MDLRSAEYIWDGPTFDRYMLLERPVYAQAGLHHQTLVKNKGNELVKENKGSVLLGYVL